MIESKSAADTGGRVPAIDGLRGLLALVAILADCLGDGYAGNGRWAAVPPTCARLGARVAASAFLTVSGFLITRGLLRDVARHGFLRSFYLRRALRILPLYSLFLTIVISLRLAASAPFSSNPLHGLRHTAASLLTLTYNFAEPDIPVTAPGDPFACQHLWFVCVEIQFYLAWPLVLLYCLRDPVRRDVRQFCVRCAIAAVLVRVMIVYGSHDLTRAYVLPFTRLDSLMLGALLAIQARQGDGTGLWRRPRAAAALGVLVLPWAATSDTRGAVWEPLGTSLLVAAVLVGCRRRPQSRVLANPALVALGAVCYGLYLFHPLLLGYLRMLTDRVWVGTVATLVLSILLAVESRRLYKDPWRKLADRLERRYAIRSKGSTNPMASTDANTTAEVTRDAR